MAYATRDVFNTFGGQHKEGGSFQSRLKLSGQLSLGHLGSVYLNVAASPTENQVPGHHVIFGFDKVLVHNKYQNLSDLTK